jgi:hypothetical protein
VLGYNAIGAAFVNAYIVGALLFIFGLIAALTGSAGVARAFNWLNAILGLWLIASPFVLGFAALHAGAYVNSLITGFVGLLFGVIAAVAAGRYVRSHEMESRTGMGTVPVTGGNGMMDSELQRTVMDRLAQDPKVDASAIDVDVHNGDVTLKGSVNSNIEREQAENDVRGVSGVRNIKDDLRVM